MNDDERLQQELRVAKFRVKLVMYVRIVFGMLVLFAAVGNCAGRQQPAFYMWVFTALMWVLLRIISEMIDAFGVLSLLKKFNAANNLPPNDRPEDPPPPPSVHV